ncbi:hypothetical protein KW790_00960 [Candidatus Parcubacteria bacterium]|nr:hypothetical protein [Candidatus Parcubacteria bacterium]
MAERVSDIRRFTLETRPAYKGVQVRIDTHHGRRYFRKRTFQTLAGPIDTTEITLPRGAKVAFTELPDNVRRQFRLRAREPVAKVIKRGLETGFLFGAAGMGYFFPLRQDVQIAFEVRTLPRGY